MTTTLGQISRPQNSDYRPVHVVLIDDDTSASQALIRRLGREEGAYLFVHFDCAETALASIPQLQPEVVVVDLSLRIDEGPKSGLRCIHQLSSLDPTIRILALTGHEASEYGLEALHHGAASFLQKPAALPHLLSLIRDGVLYSQLKRQALKRRDYSAEFETQLGINSESEAMRGVLQQAHFAASNSAPVLLLGETGTGKGVLARAIHLASSRAKKHFIRIQPQYGSPELVASELFGHSRGAFTGALQARKGLLEEAHLGTVFLDEVDQLPRETQVALLEVLQEKLFRPLGNNRETRSEFRLIAASNRRREELVQPNGLREDFFHRIAHTTIVIPALRERAEDIPALARGALASLTEKEGLPVHGLTPDAIDWLVRQPWPGNIRQLHAVVESAAYKAAYVQQSLIDVTLFTSKQQTGSQMFGGTFREKVRAYEQSLVREALTAHGQNQSKAAESLHLDRTSLRRILAREDSQ